MQLGLNSVVIVLGLDICSIVIWQDEFHRKLHLGQTFRILNPDSRADRLTQLRHNSTLAYVVGGCPNSLVRFLKGYINLMSKAPYIVLFIMLLAVVGGAVFLVTWNIPPPSEHVEKVLPDDRFPR